MTDGPVNGGPVAGFTAAGARHARMARVRSRMGELGIDALLLSHGADLPWLVGYRAMPLERLTLLVVQREDEAVLLVPALEAPKVREDPSLFTMRPWAELEDPLALAAALLRPGKRGRFALSDRAWAETVLGLQDRLPRARFVTASTITSPLRAVKDESELVSLRAAAAAADRVAGALQSGAIPLAGRTERSVSDDIAARLLAEGHERVNFAIVATGPNGASPHHDASDRRIEAGEVVVCDFGGSFTAGGDPVGYCSDITRTIAVGDPGAEIRDCYAVLRAAQQAGVAAAGPGVAAEQVDRAARSVIEAAGLGDRFIHRTGHGIGIEEHEEPYVVSGNDTVLEAGHAFSVEPGIYVPGRFGMRLEDIVVVGPDGPERINTADHDLVEVG